MERELEWLRLRRMGKVFLFLAILLIGITYILPDDPMNYWLSSQGKEGFYVFASFFFFLGFYCLGAVWRKKNFI